MKILKFYATWCGPCKQQSKILDGQPYDVVPIDVDDETSEELIQKYNIKNLPTMVVLDDEDQEVHRFNGLTTLDTIKAYMDGKTSNS